MNVLFANAFSEKAKDGTITTGNVTILNDDGVFYDVRVWKLDSMSSPLAVVRRFDHNGWVALLTNLPCGEMTLDALLDLAKKIKPEVEQKLEKFVTKLMSEVPK